MKLALRALVVLFSMPCLSFAWVSTEGTKKDYDFVYRVNGHPITITRTAASYEEAFDKAAQDCFRVLKNGRKLTEDKGLDIIDICANPRST